MFNNKNLGEVPEWSNGAVSKTVVGATLPRVRIPVSPPNYYADRDIFLPYRKKTNMNKVNNGKRNKKVMSELTQT